MEEEGAIGIELTSFTKKDTTPCESGEQKSTQAEGSCDILDDKSEPIIGTDTGQECSATEEVSEYLFIKFNFNGQNTGIFHEQLLSWINWMLEYCGMFLSPKLNQYVLILCPYA